MNIPLRHRGLLGLALLAGMGLTAGCDSPEPARVTRTTTTEQTTTAMPAPPPATTTTTTTEQTRQ